MLAKPDGLAAQELMVIGVKMVKLAMLGHLVKLA